MIIDCSAKIFIKVNVENEKTFQQDAQIVQSLINLRDEIFEGKNPAYMEILLKINSCLYRKYPEHNSIGSVITKEL